MSNNVMATAEAAMDAHLRRQANEAIRVSQTIGVRGDIKAPVLVPAADLLALLDRVRKLAEDNEEYDYINGKMSTILTDTANALKGPPDERTIHSWHDLAKVATKLKEGQ